MVPIAQLTPLVVAVIFFAVLRRRPHHSTGRLHDVLALRWARSTKAILVGLGVLIIISAL